MSDTGGGGMGGGDNWIGLNPGGWDDSTNQWGGMTDPAWGGPLPQSGWNTMQPPDSLPWWKDPKTADTMRALAGGLNTLKPMPDPNAAQVARQFPAVPPVPSVAVHQGSGGDVLSQYLQMLQQRQQQMRSQFLPKTTTGLLGG